MTFSRIIATGSYLPTKVLTNQDLEKMVATNDEWIVSRCGIKERHIINKEQNTSDMAYLASIDAIESSGINKSEIDLIIVATFSPDCVFPSVACILQKKLGLVGVPAFDLNAACAGFIYAIATADAYIKSNMARTVLVIGADAVSRFIDYTDRGTCVLFGDGAGAVILQQSNTHGIIGSRLKADGNGDACLKISGQIQDGKIKNNPYIEMDGKIVFKSAVKYLSSIALELLEQTGYKKEQIDYLVPHQANIRIIESTAKSLNLDMNKVITTVAKHGNTSAASVPLALDYAIKNNIIKKNNIILLEAIGAGLTWGASLIKI